jgi:hypothetical protein
VTRAFSQNIYRSRCLSSRMEQIRTHSSAWVR